MATRSRLAAMTQPVEERRIATGLRLADAALRVATWGPVPGGDEAQVQLDALQFAEVPIDALTADDGARWLELARRIVDSDIVYCV